MSSEQSSKKPKKSPTHNSEQQEDVQQQERIGSYDAESFTISSPVNSNLQNLTYSILSDEYSLIEDTNDWNPNQAFMESTELDENVDILSSSASSSTSISYLLDMAQQMIVNYPNEIEIPEMVAENYLNYITELLQAEQEKQMTNTTDNGAVLLRPTGVQTSFSFEIKEEENVNDINNGEDNFEHYS